MHPTCHCEERSDVATYATMHNEKTPVVYLLSNWRGNVLYIGVTSNLLKRIWDHKFVPSEGFAWKYRVNKLIYYEQCPSMSEAIEREKQLKNYSRTRKIHLVRTYNPGMIDLCPDGQRLLRAAARPS